MKTINNLLVVGAGASYAEAVEMKIPEEYRPPLMRDFIKKLWKNSLPLKFQKDKGLFCKYLRATSRYDDFMKQGTDIYNYMVTLEKDNIVNIENFFEFAYRQKEFYPNEYKNILHRGIYAPLVDCLVFGIFKNGIYNVKLPLTENIASILKNEDIVLNLNYDTIFEIGAERAGKILHFLPWEKEHPSITIAKPHGSFHFFANEAGVKQGRPYFVGSVSSIAGDNIHNYESFMPPRTNKSFQQHPLSKAIIERLSFDYAENVILWGVGFTKSDIDLYQLYKKWFMAANKISYITPRNKKPQDLSTDMSIPVCHYSSVENFIADKGDYILPKKK